MSSHCSLIEKASKNVINHFSQLKEPVQNLQKLAYPQYKRLQNLINKYLEMLGKMEYYQKANIYATSILSELQSEIKKEQALCKEKSNDTQENKQVSQCQIKNMMNMSILVGQIIYKKLKYYNITLKNDFLLFSSIVYEMTLQNFIEQNKKFITIQYNQAKETYTFTLKATQQFYTTNITKIKDTYQKLQKDIPVKMNDFSEKVQKEWNELSEETKGNIKKIMENLKEIKEKCVHIYKNQITIEVAKKFYEENKAIILSRIQNLAALLNEYKHQISILQQNAKKIYEDALSAYKVRRQQKLKLRGIKQEKGIENTVKKSSENKSAQKKEEHSEKVELVNQSKNEQNPEIEIQVNAEQQEEKQQLLEQEAETKEQATKVIEELVSKQEEQLVHQENPEQQENQQQMKGIPSEKCNNIEQNNEDNDADKKTNESEEIETKNNEESLQQQQEDSNDVEGGEQIEATNGEYQEQPEINEEQGNENNQSVSKKQKKKKNKKN